MIEPPRIPLANLPTPLVRLERLSRDLGAQLWVKRDDLTGLELSGNKIRKLEFVAGEALTTGVDALVTEGTCQSNHCRATAAVCAKLGLHCRLLLRPIPPGLPVGNHALDLMFGAETRAYPRPDFDNNRAAIVERNLGELRAAGRKPRWVPMGASEPLGCWGYLRAMAELAAQLEPAGIRDCDVVMAISSAGTYAGAVLGVLKHGLSHMRVWAVPVSDDVEFFRHEVRTLCEATIRMYDLKVAFDESKMNFIDGYVGDGYAIPYAAAIEAIRIVARSEGMLLDPVYTAKAFCALLDGVRSGQLGRQRPTIFIHTGGIFSNFAWPEILL